MDNLENVNSVAVRKNNKDYITQRFYYSYGKQMQENNGLDPDNQLH